jgi:uncharacterized CHY-type Zn-finger protein
MMAEKVQPVEDASKESFRSLCGHYSRACSIVSPCCSTVYPCRLCHDDNESHPIDRFAIKEVVCRKCDHQQEISNICSKCSITFARYFCNICNLYDDAEKGQYHCVKCGICRYVCLCVFVCVCLSLQLIDY